MFFLRISCAGLALAGLLTACQPQPQPLTGSSPTTPATGQQYRLKRTVQQSSAVAVTFTYTYNDANRLSEYTMQSGNAGGSAQTIRFQYDAQGRLTSAERLPAPSFVAGRLTYAYDGTGNLTQITLYEDINRTGTGSSQYTLTQTTTLAYGAGKQPTTVTIQSGNRTETTRYVYQQGNAIRSERTVSPGNDPAWTITYQHDDKPNPTYGLVLGSLSPEVFNRNNILYTNSERTYNERGLLTDLYTNVNEAPARRAHIQYEYEAY